MYYVLMNGSQLGPYSQTQLKMMWGNGTITADAQCWKEGMTEWISIEDVILERNTTAVLSPKPVQNNAITSNSEGVLRLHGKVLAPSDTGRRFLAFVIDYSLILALMFYVPLWMGYPEDPENAVIVMIVMLLCVVFKDLPCGGRSLGRLITGCFLIDVPRSQPATISQSIRRNAAQALWLFGPWLLLPVLEWVLPKSAGILTHALAVMFLTYTIIVINSCSNATGQGCWDAPFGTCVMSKQKRPD